MGRRKELWYFSIIDVVGILTDSPRPRKYWNALKTKLKQEGSELSQKVGQLKLESPDGKKYLTDVADTETILRLIQSIPSPKAEPFKIWLAKVGYERIQEIENPELSQERIKELYEQKNYFELRTLAHSFKPKYTYMGMPQLSEIAKQIEFNAAEKKNITETLLLIEKLIKQTELAYGELKELMV